MTLYRSVLRQGTADSPAGLELQTLADARSNAASIAEGVPPGVTVVLQVKEAGGDWQDLLFAWTVDGWYQLREGASVPDDLATRVKLFANALEAYDGVARAGEDQVPFSFVVRGVDESAARTAALDVVSGAADLAGIDEHFRLAASPSIFERPNEGVHPSDDL